MINKKIKELEDKDLEKMGIMEKIENKVYPVSPNSVERKIRKTIVLAFNQGFKQAKKELSLEIEKEIDAYIPSNYNMMWDDVVVELKQKLLGGKEVKKQLGENK